MVLVEAAAAVIAVWIAATLLAGTPKPLLGHYSQKGGFFWIKQWLTYVYLQFLRKRNQLLPHYDRNSKVASKFGFVATNEEEILEKPRPLPRDKNALDAIQIFGMDALGNTLITRMARRNNRCADVWLYLRLSSGAEYQLPHQPEVRVYNTAVDSFTAAGLNFEVLEPMRRWKVSFNGLLRSSIKREWSKTEDNNNEEIVHARFNFIWSPINAPYDSLRSVDNCHLASSIATERWTPAFLFKHLRLPDADWYDQWGQMIGSLTIGEAKPENLFLRGRKERKFGKCNQKQIHRHAHIDLYLVDGVTIHLDAISHRSGLTHVIAGYVMYPRGVSERIVDCNFDLHRLAENGILPPHIRLDIQTETQKYLAVVSVENYGFQAYLGEDWDSKVIVRRVAISGDNCNGYGVLELGYKNESGCPVTPTASIPFLEDAVFGTADSTLLTVQLSDPKCCCSNVVGGKGMSLALMTSFLEGRFIVPKGLCVTVIAYWEHIKSHSEIRNGIENMQEIAWKNKKGDLMEECVKLVDLIASTKISTKIQAEIVKSLKGVFGNDFESVRLAVRSSAIGEDGEETSAAGQNETILGVRGLDHMWVALAKCWASQFSFVAVEYKRNNGKLLNEGMGVVIQEMVSADKAGVLFTRDPVTGSPERMTVTANYGLGESVVSAAVDPDTIIIERTWRNNLSVGSKAIGKKLFQTNLNADNGTGEINVSGEMASQCCLTDEEILRLGQIGIVLENAFGGPRDIEWAIKDGQDYLLQSRAITTYERESDYLIEHELDGSLLTDDEITTKANVGEVFPGATSPLTVSTMASLFDWLSEDLCIKFDPKHIFPSYTAHGLSSFHGHVFLNMLKMLATGISDKISKETAGMGFSLLGRNFIDEKMRGLIFDRHGPMKKKNIMRQFGPALKETFWSTFARDCENAKNKLANNLIPIGPDDSSLTIYNTLTKQYYCLRDGFQIHYYISMASSVLASIMFGILTANAEVEEIAAVHFTDSNILLGSCSGVESANVPAEIQKIVTAIGKTKDWERFREMTSEDATEFLLKDKGTPGTLFRQFLKNHGHRCIKEFDLRAKPWGTDYSGIVKTIQASFVNGIPTEKLQKPETSVDESLDQITTPVKGIARRILRLLTHSARKTVGRRETAKSLAIFGVNVFREAYRKLANKMVSEGRISDPDLVYFFTHYELGHVLKTRSPKLIRKAERRQRMHSRLDELMFPDLNYGCPKPIIHKPVDMAAREAKFSLQAAPASPGEVTGRARVILKITDAPQIKPGEILITYGTDIGWSPYFPILGGVVTELGGVISHGAVVSREYGIPCLISAIRATELFQSGDLVRVDGSRGTIQLLENAPTIEAE